jgi:hypothetical protein
MRSMDSDLLEPFFLAVAFGGFAFVFNVEAFFGFCDYCIV